MKLSNVKSIIDVINYHDRKKIASTELNLSTLNFIVKQSCNVFKSYAPQIKHND